jgi:hypothetical protein
MRFDDLIGTGKQRRRNIEAERFGSLEIDHQFEPGRLGDREIARLSAFEYPPRINARIVTSVLALTEDSQIAKRVRVCEHEDAGMHRAVS